MSDVLQVYSIRTRARAVEIFTTCANLICAIEELEKVVLSKWWKDFCFCQMCEHSSKKSLKVKDKVNPIQIHCPLNRFCCHVVIWNSSFLAGCSQDPDLPCCATVYWSICSRSADARWTLVWQRAEDGSPEGKEPDVEEMISVNSGAASRTLWYETKTSWASFVFN